MAATTAMMALSEEERQRLGELTRRHFAKLDRDTQEELREMFRAMDGNDNGVVTWSEMKKWADEVGIPALTIDQWNAMDLNGDGCLEFFELGAATLLANACVCDVCHKPIMDDERLWMCKTCCFEHASMTDEQRRDAAANHQPPNHQPPNHQQRPWVCVCVGCGGQGEEPARDSQLQHEHPLHLIRNEWPIQLDKWTFIANGNVDTCSCCGETHNFVPSYLRSDADPHLFRLPGGSGAMVCEWCSTWICCRCSRIKTTSDTPSLGMWSQTLQCPESCKRKDSCAWAFSAGTLVPRAERTDRPHCRTCQPRILRQTLYRVPQAARQQGWKLGATGVKVLEEAKVGTEVYGVAAYTPSCAIM